MSVEKTLVSRIKNEVSELGGRIYPGVRKRRSEDEYPVLRYFRISTTRDHVHPGQSGFVTARFQLDVYGQTYSETRQAMNSVREKLIGWGDGEVFVAFSDNEREDYEENAKEHRIQLDILVQYSETVTI